MAYLNGEKFLFSPQVHITVPEVVETTGDSETAVMSQKAVTGLFDEVSKVAQTATQKIGTLSEFPLYNGHILNAGTWGNVIDAYKHIVIPVEGGQKISMTSSNDGDLYFACLTDYTDVVPGAAVAFSKEEGWTTKRYQGNDKTADYIIPSDGKYLVLCVVTAGTEVYPTALVIGDYDYCSTVGTNTQNLSRLVFKNEKAIENLSQGNQECVSYNELYNGFTLYPQWESGSFGRTVGQISTDSGNVLRQRSNYMSFPDKVEIISDGTYGVSLVLLENDHKVISCVDYRTMPITFTVEKNTVFRMTIGDALDMSKNISSLTDEEINAHITVRSDGIKNIIDPEVRWCAMGDSITEGFISYVDETQGNFYKVSKPDSWVDKLRRMKRWDVTNEGIGGTGYFHAGDRASHKIAESIDFTKFDMVTLAYGVNDWKYNQPLGSFDDDYETPTTIYGGMRKTIETIIAKNPLCKIVVITPINCCVQGTEATNWGMGYEYSNSGTLEDVFTAIKTVCEYYGIEMVDMTHSSIVNRKNIKTCLLDNVHPTADTHTVMARELAAKINFE